MFENSETHYDLMDIEQLKLGFWLNLYTFQVESKWKWEENLLGVKRSHESIKKKTVYRKIELLILNQFVNFQSWK